MHEWLAVLLKYKDHTASVDSKVPVTRYQMQSKHDPNIIYLLPVSGSKKPKLGIDDYTPR